MGNWMSPAQLNRVFEKPDSVDTVYSSFQLIPNCFLLSFLDSWSTGLVIKVI